MEDSAPLVYAAYWEVLCHFHIYTEITGFRSEAGQTNGLGRLPLQLFGGRD